MEKKTKKKTQRANVKLCSAGLGVPMSSIDQSILDAVRDRIMTVLWVKAMESNPQLERIRATTVFPLLPPGQFLYRTIFAEDKFLVVHWLDRAEEVLYRCRVRVLFRRNERVILLFPLEAFYISGLHFGWKGALTWFLFFVFCFFPFSAPSTLVRILRGLPTRHMADP